MHNHFTENLNTKALIERHDPKVVVEAGCGQSTVQLMALAKERGFRFVMMDVMDDPGNPGVMKLPTGVFIALKDIELLYGVSYLNFEKFADHEIDMAIVDTDHNGWTLMRELQVLERKVKPGGLVLLHDTEAFKNVNGTMEGYASGDAPYPLKEILDGPTMGEVVELYKGKWTVIAETPESNGAIAFQVTNGNHAH